MHWSNWTPASGRRRPWAASPSSVPRSSSPRSFNLTTAAGDLNLAFEPAGVGGYEELAERAVAVDLADFVVAVAALDDVIHSKEVANRLRDRAVLPLLWLLRDEIG